MGFSLPERYAWALNLVLIALIAWFAALAVSDVFALRLAGGVVPPEVVPDGSARSAVGAHQVAFYDQIAKRDIFNLAPAPQSEPAPAEDEPLSITLLGTSHLSLARPYAIVGDATGNQTLYRLGDTIPDAGKLVEVGPDRAIIMHNGHRVAIEIPHGDQGEGGSIRSFPGTRGRRSRNSGIHGGSTSHPISGVHRLDGNRYVIDRSTVNNSMQNMAKLFTQIRAVPNFENGASDGFRLSEIQPGSVFAEIGLRDGDVLTAVSGQPVRDPAKAMELLGSLRDQRTITLNVMRNGAPVQLQYSIR
ncbi:MAG: type II secretion system protein GspC [Candidatus Binataceae bacterium]